MNPERWQRIDQLFHSALERSEGERTALLAQACAGDDQLRREVESLLDSHEQATSFIEVPAGDAAAGLLSERHAGLSPGTMVKRYQVLRVLGKGGMGEVYLAEDTELHRRIALKILPSDFTRDPERVRRFVQEAHAASALNQPNIITIHEIGTLGDSHFIVTEYIEGETLRSKLNREQLQIEETLEYATQIASALEAAHRSGITHRDIKPENIMVRTDGLVKILDFGLAKLTEAAEAEASEPGTSTRIKTNPGIVLGTFTYMSPEQARGKEIDGRSDIFSFGVVLHEMLVGRSPFAHETTSDVIAAILAVEPRPPSSFNTRVPAELDRIVSKTLRKEREERYQTANDLVLDLKNLRQDLELEARLKRRLHTGGSGDGAPKSETVASVKTLRQSTVSTMDVVAARKTSSAEYLIDEIKRHKRISAEESLELIGGTLSSALTAREGVPAKTESAGLAATGGSHNVSLFRRYQRTSILLITIVIIATLSLAYHYLLAGRSKNAAHNEPQQSATARNEIESSKSTAHRLYWDMTQDEQTRFIAEQAQGISAMLGPNPTRLNEESIAQIKVQVDHYVARKDSLSADVFHEGLRPIYSRASLYGSFITEAFNERHVPPVIGLYIAMAETEYHPCEENQFGGQGLFGFTSRTAARYGAAPSERCDPRKISRAAAHYLDDLTSEFGSDSASITLAILSYNMGEGQVREYLHTLLNEGIRERSFWALSSHAEMLGENFLLVGNVYVLRFYAAAIVGENPQAFDLQIQPLSSYTTVIK